MVWLANGIPLLPMSTGAMHKTRIWQCLPRCISGATNISWSVTGARRRLVGPAPRQAPIQRRRDGSCNTTAGPIDRLVGWLAASFFVRSSFVCAFVHFFVQWSDDHARPRRSAIAVAGDNQTTMADDNGRVLPSRPHATGGSTSALARAWLRARGVSVVDDLGRVAALTNKQGKMHYTLY